jgi:hypothetical protein
VQCTGLYPLCAKSGHRPTSLDHLVSAGYQRRRNSKTERFGGLEVDDKLVFGGQLNWKIARLLALENAGDIMPARL